MEERKKKVLLIDCYADGISETEFYCTEIVLAALCGYQEYEYYFYYLLLKIVESNWKTRDKDFDIFEILGLKITVSNISSNKMEFTEFVYKQIDLSLPVIIPVNYNTLFFVEDYEKKDDIHFLLINGYNKENDTIYLKLSPHVYTDPINNNVGLYTLRLSTRMLVAIWEKSSKSEMLNRIGMNNIAITVEKKENTKIDCLQYIIENIIQKFDFESSFFIKKIMQTDNLSGKELRGFFVDLKITHEKYINSFFFILLKLLNKEKSCLDIVQNIENEWKDYVENRALMLVEIQKKIQRKQIINLNTYVESVMYFDNKLKNLLVKINEKLCIDSELYKTNIIESCRIEVSSEDDDFFSPYNVVFDNDEIWRSNNKDTMHWLILELPVQSYVKKMVIVHDTNYNKTTKDFSIEVSNNKLDWIVVETISDNNKTLTTHYFESTSFKYILINIFTAGRYTNQARIRQIKLFGKIFGQNKNI